MYKINTISGENAIKSDFFIPHLVSEEVIKISERCEVWGTEFKDAGEDYCEFRFFKSNETEPFIIKKQKGY